MRRNVPPAAYRGESFVDAARNRSRFSRGQDFSVWDLPPRRPSTSYKCRAVFYQVRLEVRAAVMSLFPSRRGRFLTMEVFRRISLRYTSPSCVIWFLTLSPFFPPFFFFLSSFTSSFSYRAYRGGKITSPRLHTRIRFILQISFIFMFLFLYTFVLLTVLFLLLGITFDNRII